MSFNKTLWLKHVLGVATLSFTDNVTIKLHTGDPGAAGTANLSSLSEAALTITESSGTFTAAPVLWQSAPSTETLTHYSLWADGTLLDTGTLDQSVSLTAGRNLLVTGVTIS